MGLITRLPSLGILLLLGLASLVSAKFADEIEDKQTKYSMVASLRYLSKATLFGALVKDTFLTSLAETDLQSANYQDSSDCVKRLICELRGESRRRPLDWDEELIVRAISPQLDYKSPIVQLQLAADLGSTAPEQCQIVYSRCAFGAGDIMTLMRQRGTSLDIPTNGDTDCTVIFLWNKRSEENPEAAEEGGNGDGTK